MEQLTSSSPSRDALGDALRVFESRSPGFSHATLRTFEVLSESEWRNAGWLLCARIDGDDMEPPDRVYPNVRMRSTRLLVTEFGSVLDNALAHSKVLGVPSPDIGNTSVDIGAVSFENGFGPRPGCVWSVDQRDGIPQGFGRSLISFAEPYFESLGAAFVDWFRLDGWHGSCDSRFGNGFVYVPETRAWIAGASLAERAVCVRVDRHPSYEAPLRLKGRIGRSGRQDVIDEDVQDGAATFPMPLGSETLELILVAEDDTVLSWHSESSGWVNGRGRVLSVASSGSGSDELVAMIRGGECDHVEFKPFVLPKSPKFEEFLRVICSFANTRGGALLIGVQDDATVVGIEKPACAWAKAALPRALEQFAEILLRSVGERLNPRPSINVREHVIGGHTVLAIHVDRAVRRPVTLDRDVYVRCAGSSVRADGTALHGLIADTVAEMSRRRDRVGW